MRVRANQLSGALRLRRTSAERERDGYFVPRPPVCPQVLVAIGDPTKERAVLNGIGAGTDRGLGRWPIRGGVPVRRGPSGQLEARVRRCSAGRSGVFTGGEPTSFRQPCAPRCRSCSSRPEAMKGQWWRGRPDMWWSSRVVPGLSSMRRALFGGPTVLFEADLGEPSAAPLLNLNPTKNAYMIAVDAPGRDPAQWDLSLPASCNYWITHRARKPWSYVDCLGQRSARRFRPHSLRRAFGTSS